MTHETRRLRASLIPLLAALPLTLVGCDETFGTQDTTPEGPGGGGGGNTGGGGSTDPDAGGTDPGPDTGGVTPPAPDGGGGTTRPPRRPGGPGAFPGGGGDSDGDGGGDNADLPDFERSDLPPGPAMDAFLDAVREFAEGYCEEAAACGVTGLPEDCGSQLTYAVGYYFSAAVEDPACTSALLDFLSCQGEGPFACYDDDGDAAVESLAQCDAFYVGLYEACGDIFGGDDGYYDGYDDEDGFEGFDGYDDGSP
jgi:hypothetical protein